jgi:hypothetical protein
MKKLLAVIVVFTYLAVTSGIVVCLHYCMDRFDSADIGTGTSDKCGKCGMHKDGGCCKDEVMVVKLQTSHLASSNILADFSLPAVKIINTEFLLIPFRNYTIVTHSIAHSPPLSEQDTYLTNCVFRI